MEQGWPRRISDLLDIPVRPDDNLSSLVCSKGITRVKSLEIASVDLKAFKRSVRSSLKRSKETTGEVGVSPNILRERPRSKVARTLFTSNKAQHNTTQKYYKNNAITFIGSTTQSPSRRVLAENIRQNDPRGSKSPERGGVETASCSHGSPVLSPSTPPGTPSVLLPASGRLQHLNLNICIKI